MGDRRHSGDGRASAMRLEVVARSAPAGRAMGPPLAELLLLLVVLLVLLLLLLLLLPSPSSLLTAISMTALCKAAGRVS
jgi:hypothetical protein